MQIALCYPTGGHPTEDFRDSVELLSRLAAEQDHEVVRIRTTGVSLLPQARSLIAAEALKLDPDVLLWIDDDIAFEPAEALTLCQACIEGHDIIGAVCPTKSPNAALTGRFTPGTKPVVFFDGGEIMQVSGIGLGVTAIAPHVFQALQSEVPFVQLALGQQCHAYFHELIEDGLWYGEDIGLCIRAQKLGFKCWVDTRMRVIHQGDYRYRVEDCFYHVPYCNRMLVDVSKKYLISDEQAQSTAELIADPLRLLTIMRAS